MGPVRSIHECASRRGRLVGPLYRAYLNSRWSLILKHFEPQPQRQIVALRVREIRPEF
jgi:hypothetical protein